MSNFKSVKFPENLVCVDCGSPGNYPYISKKCPKNQPNPHFFGGSQRILRGYTNSDEWIVLSAPNECQIRMSVWLGLCPKLIKHEFAQKQQKITKKKHSDRHFFRFLKFPLQTYYHLSLYSTVVTVLPHRSGTRTPRRGTMTEKRRTRVRTSTNWGPKNFVSRWAPKTMQFLRKFQQTPGTYPRPSTTCLWRKSFILVFSGT